MRTAIDVTWDQVLAFRMHRHLLADRDATKPGQVASRLCGLHAQLASTADASVSARSDLPAGSAAHALSSRALIKTWMMRGTLHLFDSDDHSAYAAAGTIRTGYRTQSWLDYHKVTLAQMDSIIEAAPHVLAGRELTREELAKAIASETGEPDLEDLLRSGWGDLLKPSAYRGDLCFGSGLDRNVTFVRPRDWIGPAPEPVDSTTAVAIIARRYLRTYGPATRADMVRWWGGKASEAGQMLRRITDETIQVNIEGYPALMLKIDVDVLVNSSIRDEPMVRLLPAFDPYVGGSAPRAHPSVVPSGAKDLIFRPQGWQSAVMADRGRMVGVWTRDGRVLRLEPFERLGSDLVAAFEQEASRLSPDLDIAWAE